MGGDHKFAWDFDTLRKEVLQAGFSSASRSSQGEIEAEFCIDGNDWWRGLESLYVNATK
jgi:hypothetical protein